MSEQPFKRFRMEVDLRRIDLSQAELPDGYRWLPWRPLLAERHAQIKWRSFRDDLDGRVFECLSNIDGCRRLINEISSQPGFSTYATWMVAFQPEPTWPAHDCGTIQGIARSGGVGSIQNVGIIPEHRGNGLGKAIVLKSLQGFWQSGMNFATLEVTALNRVAVSLYKSLGFRVTRVLYRSAEGGAIIKGTERSPVAADAEVTTG
ncbi:MAG: GNAT family N-acetyltransferase [Fuerstiella sp.]